MTTTPEVHAAFVQAIQDEFAKHDIHPEKKRDALGQPIYNIATSAGKYTCTVAMPALPGFSPLFCSVHGRFANASRAMKKVGTDTSGKWNFDGNGTIKTVEAAKDLATRIVLRISRA